MCTLTNKNRIDAVLRVEKFTSTKRINENLSKTSDHLNLKSEIGERFVYDSISVLKPIKSYEKNLDCQITNSGIPYLQKQTRSKPINIQVSKPEPIIKKTPKVEKIKNKFLDNSNTKHVKSDKKFDLKKQKTGAKIENDSKLSTYDTMYIRKTQRNQIYALNKLMTELEHRDFMDFCRDNNIQL